jgi:hypothetical protein
MLSSFEGVMMMWSMKSPRAAWAVLLATLVAGPAASPCRAADPPARGPEKTKPHVPEALEMLGAILAGGADMGPGSGWFHPAQIRYDWAWLAPRDKDGNKAITAEELGGPADLFRRLDRDRDGAITPDDLDWSPRSTYLRQQSMARMRFFQIDRNSNGRISREEWDAFFERAAKGKKALTPEDLADAFYAPPPRPPQGGGPSESEKDPTPLPLLPLALYRWMFDAEEGEPTRWMLLKGLYSGEIGSLHEGPKVGEIAPDFTLATHDGTRKVTLSEYRGLKPVALVFGSFT